MKYQVAYIVTTIIRDELLKQTILTTLPNLPSSCLVIIADQKPSNEKDVFYTNLPNVRYLAMPWDTGLFYSRNMCVDYAFKLSIPYCFISADSIQIPTQTGIINENRPISLELPIQFLEKKTQRGIVGFELLNRVRWEYDMELIKGKYFELSMPKRASFCELGASWQQIDICKNFFLAKTKCLKDVPWDNVLSLAEHEDMFYRVKCSNWEVFYSGLIKGTYIKSKPKNYDLLRNRLYNIFVTKLRKKYNITGWVNMKKN